MPSSTSCAWSRCHDRWKAFEEEYKQSYKAYDVQFEQYKNKALTLKAEMDKLPRGDPKADQITAEARNVDRKAQDLGEEAKKVLGKKNDEMTVVIYREIREAVQAYARANAIDLVMHYNDGILPADVDNPQNVQRKLQAGPLIPIYAVEGLDITDTIVFMLNQRATSKGPQLLRGLRPREVAKQVPNKSCERLTFQEAAHRGQSSRNPKNKPGIARMTRI